MACGRQHQLLFRTLPALSSPLPRLKSGEKNVAEPAKRGAAEVGNLGTKIIDVGMVGSILKGLYPLFPFCRSFRRRCPAAEVYA